MELTVRKFDLLEELLLLQGAIERKTTMPILSNILVEATPDGRLQLAATDLELALVTSCPATVKKSGACALPARKLLDYVKLLPDAEISIKRLENHWVQLRCGRSTTRMVGMARENFPELPQLPSTGLLRLPAATFADMVEKTIFAISTEETRYTLNGALLVLKPASLTLVATDGHRLAHIVNDTVVLEGLTTETKALVPHKAMSQVAPLLDRAPEGATLEFAHNETHIFFRLPTRTAATRLLAARKLTGQFPNYEAVLPKAASHSIALQREEFAGAVRRVGLFADERSRAIRLRFEADKLTLSAASSDAGETEEDLDISFTADPVLVGFNADYLKAFLDVVSSTEVRLEIKDEQSAGQLRPEAVEGVQYRYVIMPMRI